MIESNSVYITPEKAGDILATHYKRIEDGAFKQRTISRPTVAKYANDMRTGQWILCPQPIVIDESGNILDGQHRLEAVRQSGKEIQFIVTTGWPARQGAASTIDCIDGGRPRSVSARLAIHDTKNACKVAAAAAAVARIVNGGDNVPMSMASTLHILDGLGIRQHVERILNIGGGKFVAGRYIGPLAYYMTVRPGKAADFATRIATIDVEKNTAPWVFMKYRNSCDKGTPQANYIRALSSCLQAWDTNEEMTYVRQSEAGCRWLAKQNTKLRDSVAKLLNINIASV